MILKVFAKKGCFVNLEMNVPELATIDCQVKSSQDRSNDIMEGRVKLQSRQVNLSQVKSSQVKSNQV